MPLYKVMLMHYITCIKIINPALMSHYGDYTNYTPVSRVISIIG